MTNQERTALLIEAGTRLDNASADLTSTDKLPAKKHLRAVICSILRGTLAEEFTAALTLLHVRDGQAFDFLAFKEFVALVSAAQDEDLTNVFIYCKAEEMTAI